MDLPKNESDQVDLDSQTVCDSKDDEANIPVIECSGEVCSNHGIQFVVCVTECIPVTDVSLLPVAKECVFATKPVRDMTPKEKRFLLYYWYATSVYQFRGKGNRVNLPNCLVCVICALYPEPNGNYCWTNIVSTLLLLGIRSLNALLAHSIAVKTSYRSSLGITNPDIQAPCCIRFGYSEKVRKAHFLLLLINRISSQSIVPIQVFS
jgi:hypothetical protein